jgi:hypothetical protein
MLCFDAKNHIQKSRVSVQYGTFKANVSKTIVDTVPKLSKADQNERKVLFVFLKIGVFLTQAVPCDSAKSLILVSTVQYVHNLDHYSVSEQYNSIPFPSPYLSTPSFGNTSFFLHVFIISLAFLRPLYLLSGEPRDGFET